MGVIDKLHYITSGINTDDIVSEVTSYLEGGGRWVQLRMKDADDDTYRLSALAVRKLTLLYGAVFIVNDRIDIAKYASADGVHLGKSDSDTVYARNVMGPDAIIGRTANNIDDIIELNSQDINYIGLGPLRFTSTKKNLSPILGFEGYSDIYEQLSNFRIISVPIVAIGGIVQGDLKELSIIGLHGIAVSSVIAHSIDIVTSTRNFVELINKNFK